MIGPTRRQVALGVLALGGLSGTAKAQYGGPMVGQIGKARAKPGERDRLAALILEGAEAMPGCLSYIVAKDQSDADMIWITEVWLDRHMQFRALHNPAVRALIDRAQPLIASFEIVAETGPVGGIGLPTS